MRGQPLADKLALCEQAKPLPKGLLERLQWPLLQCQKQVEVLLLPINGKWGNLTAEQAVELTAAVQPRYVLPNHYDMMALNAENPRTFQWLCGQRQLATRCIIPTVMDPFVWA